MPKLFIPEENEFKQWVKEAVKEYMNDIASAQNQNFLKEEPLLSRKEIAKILNITLVTLTDWTKKGLPFYSQGIKQYFIRSEVLHYMQKNRVGHYKFSKRLLETNKIE